MNHDRVVMNRVRKVVEQVALPSLPKTIENGKVRSLTRSRQLELLVEKEVCEPFVTCCLMANNPQRSTLLEHVLVPRSGQRVLLTYG